MVRVSDGITNGTSAQFTISRVIMDVSAPAVIFVGVCLSLQHHFSIVVKWGGPLREGTVVLEM